MDFITKNIQDNKNKPNFIDQIKDFFASLKQNHIGANNFKAEKEEIKNYQELMADERQRRKRVDPLDIYGESEPKATDDFTSPQKTSPKQDLQSAAPRPKEETAPPVVEKKNADIENIKNKFAKSWEAPTILKTNLVKGENTTFIDWHQNYKALIWTCLSAVFLLAVVYGGLMYWEVSAQKQKLKLDSEIEAVKTQILAENDKISQIDDFQEKLKYADWLLKKHIYFTNFLAFLENNLLPNVYLTAGFSGDTGGSYTFPAVTDNFRTMSNQLLFLKSQKEVVSAKIDGGQPSIEKVNGKKKESLEFSLYIALKPDIFYKGSSTRTSE